MAHSVGSQFVCGLKTFGIVQCTLIDLISWAFVEKESNVSKSQMICLCENTAAWQN